MEAVGDSYESRRRALPFCCAREHGTRRGQLRWAWWLCLFHITRSRRDDSAKYAPNFEAVVCCDTDSCNLSRIAKHGEPLRDGACEVCFGAVQPTYFKLDFDGLPSPAVACVQYSKWLTIPLH